MTEALETTEPTGRHALARRLHRVACASACAAVTAALAFGIPSMAAAEQDGGTDKAVGSANSASADKPLYGDEKIEVDILAEQLREAQSKGIFDSVKACAMKFKANALAARIPEQEQLSANAARALYKTQQSKYQIVESLLSSKSIDEFVQQLDYIRAITDSNFAEMRKARDMREQSKETEDAIYETNKAAAARVEEIRAKLEAARAERVARAQAGIAEAKHQAATLGGKNSITEEDEEEAEEEEEEEAEEPKTPDDSGVDGGSENSTSSSPSGSDETSSTDAAGKYDTGADAGSSNGADDGEDAGESGGSADSADSTDSEEPEPSESAEGADSSESQNAAPTRATSKASTKKSKDEEKEKSKEPPVEATQDTSALDDGADWTQTKEEFVDEWGPRIDAYLQGSPLYGHGDDFAKSAWKYCIDPRWSAAISNTESSKGSICIRPHNAWGWGAADSDPYNLASEWGSWEEAIDAHARGLSEGYGYTISIRGASTYCPPSWQHWYNNTLSQMAQI